MLYFKEVKLLYTGVIILLEVEMFVNTKAMESSSSITHARSDFKSLELCASRSQQRLGSVFGNFTRHHKKGHRRRKPSTSISPSTVFPIENGDEATTIIDDVSTTYTYPKLPKALGLSALDEYDTIKINRIFDSAEHELRHRSKYRERVKEVMQELEKESLTKNVNKVKKMYRESNSAGNRLNGKDAKRGIFLTENCTTVIAQIGTTAVLHCEVSDITENTVTWIRKSDYSLLSVGLVTYSADSRFFSAHGRHVKDWALHIRFATSADAGYYECQVPTHPPTSIFFKLILVAAYAEIVGESEKLIHEGSMLRLVCVVKRSTEPPSYVFWYFENRMINYDQNGVTVTNGRQTSELVIRTAEPRHAGNYTCVPANAKPTSVTVHIVQSETPAAMQHGNNAQATAAPIHFLTNLTIKFICLKILLCL